MGSLLRWPICLAMCTLLITQRVNTMENLHSTTKTLQHKKKLRDLYLQGLHHLTNNEDQKAITTLRQTLAQEDYAPAQNLLGWCYEHGHGVEKSPTIAAQLYLEAAKHDYPVALFNLGYCYERGIGVGQNFVQALHFYQATTGRFPPAQLKLGQLYLEGLGVKKDPKHAFTLFEQAAEKGYQKAFFALARCHELGKGTPKNQDAATYWYTNYQTNKDSLQECVICFDPLIKEDDEQPPLAGCPRGHIVHSLCLQQWKEDCFSTEKDCTCPECREMLSPYATDKKPLTR